MRITHRNSTLFESFGAWYAPYILGVCKKCRVLVRQPENLTPNLFIFNQKSFVI
ncbi:hypothetical protein [Alysiella crassa]|uniref:hypothetical protein n=1 Tax=Alysiella crassa TaxID=153491 RepID=UPI001FD1D356|nr:hypothetical protein [Alysiella crassa]UOP06232.1 hypothetical protein LVJ80_10460 [Alysiella crassa]